MRHTKCPKCGPGASVTKFGRCVVCGSKIAAVTPPETEPMLTVNNVALIIGLLFAVLATVRLIAAGPDLAFGLAVAISLLSIYVARFRKARATT